MTARRFTLNEFIERSKRKFGDKFNFTDSDYQGNKKPIVIECRTHGKFHTLPAYFIRSQSGCPSCGYKLTLDDFIVQAMGIHNDRYDYSRVEWVNTTTKVEIVCKVHGSFEQEPYMHYNRGRGCPRCAVENSTYSTPKFVDRANQVHSNKYDYTKTIYQHNDTPVVITCPLHGDYKQKPRVHIEGSGCSKCFSERNRSSKEEFINNSLVTHGNRYDYTKIIYRDNKSKVIITCKVHGDFKITPNAHVSCRQGCPRCKESKGETRVRQFLELHGINHVQEHRIEPLPFRYDFYLPEKNVLVEYHGQQHYKPVSIFGGKKGFRKTIKRDKAKRELAKRNGYTLITMSYRHSYNDSLERLLKAKLTNLGYVFRKNVNKNVRSVSDGTK